MTDRARKLLEDAMTLSEDERLDLADQLLATVPGDASEALRKWAPEIRRRVAEIRSGLVVGRPADEVADEIRATLAQMRAP